MAICRDVCWPPAHLARFCRGKHPTELTCDDLEVGQQVQIASLVVDAEVRKVFAEDFLCELLLGGKVAVRMPVALLRKRRSADEVPADRRPGHEGEVLVFDAGTTGGGDVVNRITVVTPATAPADPDEEPEQLFSTSGRSPAPALGVYSPPHRTGAAGLTVTTSTPATPTFVSSQKKKTSHKRTAAAGQQVDELDGRGTSTVPANDETDTRQPPPAPSSPESIFSDSPGRRGRKREAAATRMRSPDGVRQSTSFSRSLYNSARKDKKTEDFEDILRQTERDYVFSQLPRTQWTKVMVQECPYCLGEFEPSDTVVRLPCLHTFHASCVEEWVKTNGTCPTCLLDVCSNLMPAGDDGT